jgi:hypothetical protein
MLIEHGADLTTMMMGLYISGVNAINLSLGIQITTKLRRIARIIL